MGRMKEYALELADKLDKEFEEVTNEDIIEDFRRNANAVWFNDESTSEELEACKQFLDTMPYSKISYYEADEYPGGKFKVGDVIFSGDGVFYLIIKD